MPVSDVTAGTQQGDGEGLLLSFCIPTYNRAGKLALRLEALRRVLSASDFRSRVEVVVSDNASVDDTDRIIHEGLAALAPLCAVQHFRHPVNVGGEANFKSLYERARGDYVWIFSDDDVLKESAFDALLRDLDTYRPQVCVSSFVQPPWSEENRLFECGGKDVEVVTDMRAAVEYLNKFREISLYIHRRHPLTEAEEAISTRACTTTYFWFVALAIMLLVKREAKLLVRSAVVAGADEDWEVMRYSPRVFSTAKDAVLIGLDDHPERAYFEKALVAPRGDVMAVGHLFRYCVGLSGLDKSVEGSVMANEYKWVRQNLRPLFTSHWRNALKLPAILVLFPIVTRLRHDGVEREL